MMYGKTTIFWGLSDTSTVLGSTIEYLYFEATTFRSVPDLGHTWDWMQRKMEGGHDSDQFHLFSGEMWDILISYLVDL